MWVSIQILWYFIKSLVGIDGSHFISMGIVREKKESLTYKLKKIKVNNNHFC